MGTTASSSLFAIDPLLLEILSSLDFTQRESLLTLNKRTGDLLTSEAAYMVRRGMLRTSQRARAGGGGPQAFQSRTVSLRLTPLQTISSFSSGPTLIC